MRRIYASPRMQNVERLAAVLAERGIATRITNRRAYAGSSFANFSYAHPGNSQRWPTLWVVHANDHAGARQLVHDLCIEPPTRYASELAQHRARQEGARKPVRVAAYVRTALLIGLLAAIGFYASRAALRW